MDDSTNPKTRKRTRRTAADWRAIMARQEASGLTCEVFCAAEGVGRSAFWRWRCPLAAEDAQAGNGAPMFVELSGGGASEDDVRRRPAALRPRPRPRPARELAASDKLDLCRSRRGSRAVTAPLDRRQDLRPSLAAYVSLRSAWPAWI